MDNLENITIVLVKPQDSRNVGAVCRAMKNMGFGNLTIVLESLIDPRLAEVLAIHASDVLDNAVLCTSISEAIKGVSFVAGVTRRRGKRRKYFSITPRELAEKVYSIGMGKTAILFGNEVHGLTDEELSYCHVSVAIPSCHEFPSLNLSHAVQIITYEIYMMLNGKNTRYYTPIGIERLEYLVKSMTGALKKIGFFKQVNDMDMRRYLGDILGRASLSEGEAKQMEKIFKKIEGLFMKNRKLP